MLAFGLSTIALVQTSVRPPRLSRRITDRFESGFPLVADAIDRIAASIFASRAHPDMLFPGCPSRLKAISMPSARKKICARHTAQQVVLDFLTSPCFSTRCQRLRRRHAEGLRQPHPCPALGHDLPSAS